MDRVLDFAARGIGCAGMNRALLAAVALLCFTGCSGKYHPVSGKVLFQGAPATGAVVVFHPVGNNAIDAMRPSGKVREDGTFLLTSETTGDGAPPGDYEIAISWFDAPPPAKAPEGQIPTSMGGEESKETSADRMGGKYHDPKKSGLKATVRAGMNQLEPFDLK